MEYKVLVCPSAQTLETTVNMHINLGWELIGGVGVAMNSNGRTKYTQAVTKVD